MSDCLVVRSNEYLAHRAFQVDGKIVSGRDEFQLAACTFSITQRMPIATISCTFCVLEESLKYPRVICPHYVRYHFGNQKVEISEKNPRVM